jgi:hypothetical protein
MCADFPNLQDKDNVHVLTEDPQIFGDTVQNLVARATWNP